MDDRIFYLAAGALIAAFLGMFFDYLSGSFAVPQGFWIVLGAVYTFIGAAIARSRNGKDDDG